MYAARFVATVVLSFALSPFVASAQVSQNAVDRAHRFLATPDFGRTVLGYVHLGAEYKSHKYTRMTQVIRDGRPLPGFFALVYRYQWSQDGATDIVFLSDSHGHVYKMEVLGSNASLQKPFFFADLAMKYVGGGVQGSFERQLNEKRKKLQEFVQQPDARGMLTWTLAYRQAVE